MSQNLITVSQLNDYMKMLVDNNAFLGSVFVRGEISNFTNHYKTGHLYFSLKDESALVRAVMFRTNAMRLRFLPENGMKVILHGRVSVFPRDGQYQLYVDDMQPDGVGALYLAYEQLRRKLEAEGLFDASRKRSIPPVPERVGVITSPTGAAVRDMIQVMGRRFPAAEIILYPALVQGADAPKSLIAGLRYFNEQQPVDTIIIGRGGGSAEDLFAFNNEELAREVAASAIPVISAVGHETDFTICDFVADLRAPTPSAAAELAVPDTVQLRGILMGAAQGFGAALSRTLALYRAELTALAGADALRSPRYYVEEKRMTVAYLCDRMQTLESARVTKSRADFAALCAKMETLSPLRVLARGYTAVFSSEGSPIVSGKTLGTGDTIHVRFADSTVDATVVGVRESE